MAHGPGEPRDRIHPVEVLGSPSDLDAWHELPEFAEPTTRRVRRIDAWREGEALRARGSRTLPPSRAEGGSRPTSTASAPPPAPGLGS
ncbi:hypothetical protein GCM10027073_47770 [Streptomyces chlorus]|uniref:Uncharacterized protein n=1 Tax=Streptomyces chlorus TaxID=887452 RepID=A0ABW1E041_9ACTN